MLKRDERDEDMNDDVVFEDVVFFAFSVVRLSAVANMITDNVCTFVMCVLALWSRSDLAKGLNKRDTFAEATKAWRKGFKEHQQQWESGAAGMPFGRDYLDAPQLQSYELFTEHHNHDDDPSGWAQNDRAD
jgi:hypothetical protein